MGRAGCANAANAREVLPISEADDSIAKLYVTAGATDDAFINALVLTSGRRRVGVPDHLDWPTATAFGAIGVARPQILP